MREGASYPQSGQSVPALYLRSIRCLLTDEDVVVRTLRTVQFGRWPLSKRIPERCRLFRLEASRPDRVAVDENHPAPLVPV